MEVEILETFLVYPSPSPFSSDQRTTLPLSHLDNDRNLHFTFRTLRLYAHRRDPSPDPADAIARALSIALFLYYPLAGSLHRRPCDARLELSCSAGQGVPLTRASSARTLAFLLDRDPGLPVLGTLAPDLGQREELARPLALQVTRFACGGFALGMCVHHAMCDGAGATQFLSAVAEIARGAGGPGVEPVWNRAGLLGSRRPPRVTSPFHEYLGFDGGVTSSRPYGWHGGSRSATVRVCSHVDEACLDRFRSRLSEEAGSSFTNFEALTAFIWRARIKISSSSSNEVVKLVYSMNIKKLLNPELPTGYWGNVCVPVYVCLTERELVEQPLWKTASLIKRSKERVTDEYVRSYIDFQELHYAKGITAGRRVFSFTDWRHLGHSEVDFGWGGPLVVLPLSWNLLGSTEPCFFLPYAAMSGQKKDGFRVLVSLSENEALAFKEDMGMFAI